MIYPTYKYIFHTNSGQLYKISETPDQLPRLPHFTWAMPALLWAWDTMIFFPEGKEAPLKHAKAALTQKQDTCTTL